MTSGRSSSKRRLKDKNLAGNFVTVNKRLCARRAAEPLCVLRRRRPLRFMFADSPSPSYPPLPRPLSRPPGSCVVIGRREGSNREQNNNNIDADAA